MPNPTQPPINPHWREFFRRVRQEAQRLDALEMMEKEKTKPAPGGPH